MTAAATSKGMSLYVIELLKESKKLYINYSSKTDTENIAAFYNKNPALRNKALLRNDLIVSKVENLKSNKAYNECMKLTKKLSVNGYTIIAGPAVIDFEYHVYVIELNNNPLFLYVGESQYPPEIRLQQHIYGYHRAQKLNNITYMKLVPEHYQKMAVLTTKSASKHAEKHKYNQLKKAGYEVLGGH